MPNKCCLILRSIVLAVIFIISPGPSLLARSVPQSAQSKISLHLRWSGQQGVLRYRLQLAHDEQFKDIVFDRAVYGTEYVVTELGPGRYFWRVAPAVKETGTFSTARAVEIAEDNRTPQPQPAMTPRLIPTSNAGWRTTTGAIALPLVAHLRSTSSSDLVGVNSDGMVYGLDGANGTALWTARFRPNAKRGEQTGNGGAPTFTPILIDGRNGLANVVVAFDGGVRALDGSTGRELWRAALKNSPVYGALATVAGGAKTLLIASNDSPSLTLLKSENGEIISDTKLDAAVVAAPAPFPLPNETAVVLALEGGTLDVRNSLGERILTLKMDTMITTPPLVVAAPRGNIVLVGTENGLISLNAEDLKPIGRIATEGDAPTGLLAAEDLDGDGAPEVFMLTRRGRLVTVGSNDGKIKWYSAGATDAASTAFADLNSDGVLDVIVAAGKDFAHGFSGRDGALLWKAEGETAGASPATPVNQSRALVAGTFGDGSSVFVVGTDTARTGLRAIGLPKNSVKAANE